ncbi:MAG: uridine kinase [Ruminococcus sp.]|nr:uridine kinase [Ruminococcus sp.]
MNAIAIAEEIKKRRRSGCTLLVGLDGLGGAGKSTASEEIKNILEANNINTVIFHIDDFIHTRAVRYNDDYPQWEQYYYLQWRYDHYLSSVVRPLREGRELPPVELYDKENDRYIICRCDVPEGSVVLTEGIFLQREELSGAFDLVIYFDVPEEERLKRVLIRDGYIGDDKAIRSKYENRYFPAERYYAEKYLPAQRADVIVGFPQNP